MSVREERISDSLIEQISFIIKEDVKNKDINFVTITDAKVTSDLSQAKIYFTVLDDSKKNTTLKALKSASGFIRHQLRDRIDIRQIPELIFIYDESILYGQKIEEKIKEIHQNNQDWFTKY